MTLYLDSADVRALCTQDLAARAARATLDAQVSGDYQLPPRYDIDLANGFFRVMPAAVRGYMGLKIMTLVRGTGNRYLLALYSQQTGEMLALLDGDEITRLRTAATTAVAGQILRPEGTSHLGLVGTGFEAAGHLRAFAHCWPLATVSVYSRSVQRRGQFAETMSEELGIDVRPVESAAHVLASSEVTLLCTKSPDPVVSGDDFAPGSTVLSIGSTRPDLRELDIRTFERSLAVLVDDPAQVLTESGDVAAAIEAGVLRQEQLVSMGDWSDVEPVAGRDLLTFKSVGTALQDLVLAAELVKGAQTAGFGRDLGELASLKGVPALV